MKTSVLAAIALSVGLSSTGLGGGSAAAQPPPDYRWYGGPDNRDWDAAQHYDSHRNYAYQRPLTRDDYIYRGHDGRYYCRRSDGTTGLVVGAIGGALIGNAIGGDTLGTLLGGAGGAALGRSIERNQVHCR